MASLNSLYEQDMEILHPLSRVSEYVGADVESELLRRCGCLNTLYDSAILFKRAFSNWVRSKDRAWSKLGETLWFEYDPICNYDRTEERTETRKEDVSGNESGSITASASSSNMSDSTSSGSSTKKDDFTEQVVGYDSSAFENKGRSLGNDASTVNGTENVTATFESNNDTETDNSREAHTDSEYKYSARMFGNIGVTTTQTMISEERNVWLFDLVETITNEFKKEFCILVY